MFFFYLFVICLQTPLTRNKNMQNRRNKKGMYSVHLNYIKCIHICKAIDIKSKDHFTVIVYLCETFTLSNFAQNLP